MRTIIGWLINPVVFLTFFGPLLISAALKLIRGDVLANPAAVSSGELKALFAHSATPGLVDYTIQYYTALLVTVFWVRSWFQEGLAHWLLQNFSSKREEGQTSSSVADYWSTFLVLTGLIVGAICLVYFAGGFLGKSEVLAIYVKHTPRLGEPSFPPFNSPITWLRGLVGLHGIALSVYRRKMES